MDGARHWKGRGQGYQPPAGDSVIKFPEGIAFATLKSEEEAGPKPSIVRKTFDLKDTD